MATQPKCPWKCPWAVGWMRQVLGPGALGRPRGIGWRGRWEGGSGWGTHVTPSLIHVNVWQNPLQCCEVTSLQLIKINEKKNTFVLKKKKKKRKCPWAKASTGQTKRIPSGKEEQPGVCSQGDSSLTLSPHLRASGDPASSSFWNAVPDPP